MTTRPWLSETAQDRESEVLDSVAGHDPTQLRVAIDHLIDDNRRIHERDTLNLNPATNVMSPRAEAALSRGLGARPSLGHPGEKYEVGLEAVESLEVITADLAQQVFGARFAEIRVLSGAMANLTAFMACARPGDAIIVPPASIGGHVTHNVAGAAGLFGLEIHEAPINPDRYTVDVAGVAALAAQVQPRLITVGASLNLLPHPVAELRAVADEVGALLLFDAAHACGMLAGKIWTNPLDLGAHLITMSTYKSLAGPAGGLIVSNDADIMERIDAVAYPGLTANFDAGRTTALAITLLDWVEHGERYATAMVELAEALTAQLQHRGVRLFETSEGPTTSHQFAVLPADGVSAAEGVQRLRAANLLTCEIGTPMGAAIRIGTPEAARWGMGAGDMEALAGFVADGLAGVPGTAERVTAWRAPFDTVQFCT